jgi:hypothetical protein
VLNSDYRVNGTVCSGAQTACCVDGQVEWNGNRYGELLFEPVDTENASFTLKAVTIGVSFHWKRQEDQTFKGALHLIVEDGKLTPVNVLSVEDYLLSVISSEMSANASLELLKAHAVISRSWLLAQIHTEETVKPAERNPDAPGEMMDTPEELVKWWDRDDHVNFDVCADDHCQRYQGITRATTEKVEQAVRATWGQVLMHGGALCDARFSKSCGGVMEEFENCWEPQHHDYLQARRDGEDEENFPDLTREDNAAEWILSSPSAFCITFTATLRPSDSSSARNAVPMPPEPRRRSSVKCENFAGTRASARQPGHVILENAASPRTSICAPQAGHFISSRVTIEIWFSGAGAFSEESLMAGLRPGNRVRAASRAGTARAARGGLTRTARFGQNPGPPGGPEGSPASPKFERCIICIPSFSV